MQRQVHVYVSQRAAIDRGSSAWGPQPIGLDEVLAVLTPAERGRITITRCTPDGRQSTVGEHEVLAVDDRLLSAPTPESEEVVSAVRAQIAKTDSEWANRELARVNAWQRYLDGGVRPGTPVPEQLAAAAEAERLRRLAADRESASGWLARLEIAAPQAPPEVVGDHTRAISAAHRIADGGHAYCLDRLHTQAVELDLPDVADRIDGHRALLADRAAAETAASEASSAAWTAWAREHGSADLRAALADGYPVGRQVQHEVVSALLPPAPDGTSICRDIPEGADNGDRRLPYESARLARQRLVDAVSEIDRTRLPEGTTISVGRIRAIEHYTECPCGGDPYCEDHDSDGEIRRRATGIMVTIAAPHYEEGVWYVIDEG